MISVKQQGVAELPQLINLVRQPQFIVAKTADAKRRRSVKQDLIKAMETWLQNIYPFSHYQAEFVVNQAIKTVGGQPETRLVLADRRLAVKVARQTVMLANHYYNFIAGPSD